MALGTTTTTVGTAAIVAAGQWARDEPITMKYVVGTGIFTLSMAIFGEANPKLAEQFGTLVLVTAVLIYGPRVMKALGLIKQGDGLASLGEVIGDYARGAAGK